MAGPDATATGAAGDGATGADGGSTADGDATSTSATSAVDGDGDAGKDGHDGTELGKVRAEAAHYRREARDWKRKAEAAEAERDAATATADERLARLEAAERRNARATVDRLALAAGFHAGEPAHEADALVDLLGGEDGEKAVAARLAEVAKERPYLVASRDGAGRVLTPGRQADVADGAGTADAWLRT